MTAKSYVWMRTRYSPRRVARHIGIEGAQRTLCGSQRAEEGSEEAVRMPLAANCCRECAKAFRGQLEAESYKTAMAERLK